MSRTMRRCSKCERGMVVKKGTKGKFWACLGYKDGCSTTAEFHGYNARSGLDLELRQIDNGYIISCSFKYAEDIDDEVVTDFYCPDIENMEQQLGIILKEKAVDLIKKLQTTGNYFVDEDTPLPTEKQEKTKDIKELLSRVNKGRKEASDKL